MASGPATLAIDIGGTGLKASVLDPVGAMMADRVRVLTTYPMDPEKLVKDLVGLVKPLPPFDRVSVGFPGVVRNGRVLTAPHFVEVAGPGSMKSPELERLWSGFDLAGTLAEVLGRPTKAVNDADLQGAAVVSGAGLELVVTLGTGVGTGLYQDGELAPHLEISHHPFRKNETYDEQLGDATRKRVGNKKWNRRVKLAIDTLYNLVLYDHLYVGGGNSRHLDFDLGPTGTVIDNTAGILGGIKLWATAAPTVAVAKA
ncbi:MAG TPA: ROK family protein [Acidimicrobiales bacterium]|nr:ROK family protein [Acidimicrobiales bacterium]